MNASPSNTRFPSHIGIASLNFALVRHLPTRGLVCVTLIAWSLILVETTPAVAAPIGPGAFASSDPLINFDSFTGGTSILTGNVITNQYSSLGITFNNPNSTLRANATPLGSSAVTNSKPNVAFVMQNDGISGQPLQLLFSPSVTKVGTKFFTSFNSTITLSVFDSANSLLESFTATGTNQGPNDLWEGFVGLEETTPIARAELYSRHYSGAVFNFDIDDVRFHQIPEPSALILIACAALGFLPRRHRS